MNFLEYIANVITYGFFYSLCYAGGILVVMTGGEYLDTVGINIPSSISQGVGLFALLSYCCCALLAFYSAKLRVMEGYGFIDAITYPFKHAKLMLRQTFGFSKGDSDPS